MAIAVELLTSNTKKSPRTMSSARLPGYGTGFGSMSTPRRPSLVGPNPLPKKLGSLAKGRTPTSSLNHKISQSALNAASVRISKQSNSAGSSVPKGYDRNLNNVKPIKDIRRNGHDHHDESRTDSKPDSGGSSDANSAHDADSKRHLPAALSVDFIKHALSSNKQIYSAQEIKAKAETSWKPSGKPHTRKLKPKTGSPKEKTLGRIQPDEPQKSKLMESIQNEGFAPRVKTHELTAQIKVLRRRLGGESALIEEDNSGTHLPSRLL